MKKPELLAPAGSMDSLYAAIMAGCDAVYLSGYMFGARQFATNFSEKEIKSAINICHLYGVKVYVTVNTLIYDAEVETFLNYIDFLHKNNVDAVLIQDIGMLDLVRQTYPNLEVHASTQMHIHNMDGVKFCEKMGIKRVVLARETSIDNIKDIRDNTDLELEVFVHGALCISYSGQCLMSSLIGGRSGNRGACAGSCRLPYKIVDSKNKKYNKDNYPISTKDLSTLDNIGKLIDVGVDSLKIEGRMKRPEYVYLVVSLYRKAIDSYINNHKVDISLSDIKEMKKIFNRMFTKGFLFNDYNDNIVNPYRPNHLGIEIGKVINYKNNFVTVKLNDTLSLNDGIRIIERDLGCTLTSMFNNNKKVITAKSGDIISFKLEGNIKIGDTLVKTTDYNQLINIQNIIKESKRKVLIDSNITIKANKPIILEVSDGKNTITLEKGIASKAINNPLREDDIKKQIDRLGNTIYKFSSLTIDTDNNSFINNKDLNNIRREVIELLNNKRLYDTNYKKCNYTRNLEVLSHNKIMCTLIDSIDMYNKVKNDSYKYIYIENKNLYNKLKSDTRVVLKLPRVIEHSTLYDEPVMISELGSLANKNIIVSDFSLNVVNSYSVALLHSLGVNRVTLSYEISKEQIKTLINNFYKRYNVYPNLELIAYSKIEAMVSKFNINDYYKTKENLFLVDKFNNHYIIKNKNGYMYIIDYKDHFITDYKEYYNLGINSIRFEFVNTDYRKFN